MIYKYVGKKFPDYTGKAVSICNELITGEVVVSLEDKNVKRTSFWAICFLCTKDELEGVENG